LPVEEDGSFANSPNLVEEGVALTMTNRAYPSITRSLFRYLVDLSAPILY
jgi:hypothetical protein